MAPKSPPARGYLVGVAAAAVLSTTAIFIRHLSRAYHLPPLVLAFWRDLFVVVSLAPVLGLARRAELPVSPRELPFFAGYGLVLALFNALWTSSVALTGAALATVLVYSSTAFSVVLGRFWLAERLSLAKVAATLSSLAGCALVAGVLKEAAPRAEFLGVLLGVASGLCYALYGLFGRTAAERGHDPFTTLLYTFGFAALYLLALNLVLGPALPGAASRPSELLWLGGSLGGWGLLFALAAGPTVVGFGLYNVSLGYLPSSVANLVVTLEPVFTAITAYLLLGERLTPGQLVGSALILLGVLALRVFEARPGGAPPRAAAPGSSAAKGALEP
ncbi:MAG TPA: DMT family transporter [Anaeromyxobacteraceae bacterium]|nr:DMT family transporter [Anaeromyxobacteraceae bacterium]